MASMIAASLQNASGAVMIVDRPVFLILSALETDHKSKYIGTVSNDFNRLALYVEQMLTWYDCQAYNCPVLW